MTFVAYQKNISNSVPQRKRSGIVNHGSSIVASVTKCHMFRITRISTISTFFADTKKTLLVVFLLLIIMDETSKRGKGRGRGRGRGRGQKKQTVKASRETESVQPDVQEEPTENEPVKTQQQAKVEEKENEIIIQAPPTSKFKKEISCCSIFINFKTLRNCS